MDTCLILSIPRCGTHLVAQILTSLGLKWFNANDVFVAGSWVGKLSVPKSGYYIHSQHLHYNRKNVNLFESSGLKGVFISRDPRDQAVSSTFGAIKQFEKGKQESLREIYEKDGFDGLLLKRIRDWPNRVNQLGWRNGRNVFTTTYEKILTLKQREIQKISKFLDLGCPREQIHKCANKVIIHKPKNASQFRKGIIGDWKNHFKEEHKRVCKDLLGKVLIEEGYEKDLDW